MSPKIGTPIVPLGYPSSPAAFRAAASRKPLSEITCAEKFGQAFKE